MRVHNSYGACTRLFYGKGNPLKLEGDIKSATRLKYKNPANYFWLEVAIHARATMARGKFYCNKHKPMGGVKAMKDHKALRHSINTFPS